MGLAIVLYWEDYMAKVGDSFVSNVGPSCQGAVAALGEGGGSTATGGLVGHTVHVVAPPWTPHRPSHIQAVELPSQGEE